MTEIPQPYQSSEANPSEANPSEANPSEANPSEASSLEPIPGFGWTVYAERINGRFAMIGFLSLLLLNFLTQQDFFTWIGLR